MTRKPPVQAKKRRRSRRSAHARDQPADDHGCDEPEQGAQEREGASPNDLDHRPQQQGRLDALASADTKPMAMSAHRPPAVRGAVDTALQGRLHAATGTLHPEDHPGDHRDGEQGEPSPRSAPAPGRELIGAEGQSTAPMPSASAIARARLRPTSSAAHPAAEATEGRRRGCRRRARLRDPRGAR